MHDEEIAVAGGSLIYNRARMLHPGLERFMQRDPLGYVDGMSQYAYYAGIQDKLGPSGIKIEFTCCSKEQIKKIKKAVLLSTIARLNARYEHKKLDWYYVLNNWFPKGYFKSDKHYEQSKDWWMNRKTGYYVRMMDRMDMIADEFRTGYKVNCCPKPVKCASGEGAIKNAFVEAFSYPIYFCPNFFDDKKMSADERGIVLVHELAHVAFNATDGRHGGINEDPRYDMPWQTTRLPERAAVRDTAWFDPLAGSRPGSVDFIVRHQLFNQMYSLK